MIDVFKLAFSGAKAVIFAKVVVLARLCGGPRLAFLVPWKSLGLGSGPAEYMSRFKNRVLYY